MTEQECTRKFHRWLLIAISISCAMIAITTLLTFAQPYLGSGWATSLLNQSIDNLASNAAIIMIAWIAWYPMRSLLATLLTTIVLAWPIIAAVPEMAYFLEYGASRMMWSALMVDWPYGIYQSMLLFGLMWSLRALFGVRLEWTGTRSPQPPLGIRDLGLLTGMVALLIALPNVGFGGEIENPRLTFLFHCGHGILLTGLIVGAGLAGAGRNRAVGWGVALAAWAVCTVGSTLLYVFLFGSLVPDLQTMVVFAGVAAGALLGMLVLQFAIGHRLGFRLAAGRRKMSDPVPLSGMSSESG